MLCYDSFKDGNEVAQGDASIEEASALRSDADFVWVGVSDPSGEELARLAREFSLHELAVEDALHTHQRPKIESYDGSLFIVVRNAHYRRQVRELELGEVHIFVGPDYVIVVRHGGDDEDIMQFRERLRARTDLLKHGPAAVVYAVMDRIVDDYLPIVDALSSDIADVETNVFSKVSPNIGDTTEVIYKLKREVLEFHGATSPLVIALDQVHEGVVPQIPEDVRPYFRDVLDHLRRVSEQIDGFRELLTSILSANAALVSVRQNEIVQKISGWAAIIAVPTLISGIYGMNFKYMPELDSHWGYPYALVLMLLLGAGLYTLLRRIKWL